MSITAEQLLSGPRGRRLLLELACRLEEQTQRPRKLRKALWATTHRLDPNPGVLFGPGTHTTQREHGTPDDVALLLSELPLRTADEDVLRAALTDAVDNARYWQEPDGQDVLAATPAVRDALARLAPAPSVTSATGWWSEPIAEADQWTVLWDGPAPREPDPVLSASQWLRRWQSETMEDEQRERPSDPNAPYSGVWWSTPPQQLTRTTRSLGSFGPAGLWLVEDRFNWQRATVEHVSVAESALVYEVDGAAAWAELCRAHPLEVTAAKRQDWYRTTGRVGRWVVPDWARVADDYDAVHLTVTGYLAAAGTAIPVDDDTASVIAGWDPDQTYWLTETTTPLPHGETWVLSENDMWVRTSVQH